MQKYSVIFTTLGLLLSTLFVNSLCLLGTSSGVVSIESKDTDHQFRIASVRAPIPPTTHRKQLDYGLSHLVLRPKIIAGDGLTIYGQFDIV